MSYDRSEPSSFFTLFFKFSEPYRVCVVLAPLFKVFEVGFDLAIPLLIARMVDEGVLKNNPSEVVSLGAILLFMYVFGFGCTLIAQKLASIASQGIGGDLRDVLFEKILHMKQIDRLQFGYSSLCVRLTSDINQVQLCIALLLRQLIRWPIIALGSIICTFFISFQIGSIFVVCALVVGGIFWIVVSRMIPLISKTQANTDELYQMGNEIVEGQTTIRGFHQVQYMQDRFDSCVSKLSNLLEKNYFLSLSLNPLTFLVLDLGICAILGYSLTYSNSLTMAPGDILACINYMLQSIMAITYVANLTLIFVRATKSSQRILSCLACDSQYDKDMVSRKDFNEDSKQSLSNNSITSENIYLEFKDVSFSYPNSHASQLNNLSFVLKNPQRIGIVGPIGSGKTTLVQLMSGLLRPSSGEACVYHEQKATSKASIGSVYDCAMVFQDPQFISGTLRENLSMYCPDVTDQKIYDALDLACLKDELIKKNFDLDTKIDAQASEFSGGQKARLNIARAFLSARNMLIFDNSFCALDARTSKEVFQNILNNYSDRSLVFISDRMNIIQKCDVVIVLTRTGEIEAIGTPDELLLYSKTYQAFFDMGERE